MHRIGFVTSPLSDRNAVRGVGFYTKHLLVNLKLLAPKENLEIVEIACPTKPWRSRENCDLVHIPFFTPFAPSIPSGIPVPLVITIHDVTPLEFPDHYPPGFRGWFNLQLQKYSLRRAGRVITDAYASVKSIHRLLAVPYSRIRFVHLAADPVYVPITDRRILARAKAKYDLPDKFVLYVGDVNWNKNLPGLTAAVLDLRIPLVVVGQQAGEIKHQALDHPELRHLPDWLATASSNPLIHRLGFVPGSDLAAIYNLATVFCLASFAEGFGIPVLEAMASGTPVACSRIPSLAEIAGDAALYFDPADSADVSKVIRQLFINSRLRSKLRQSGLAQSAKFSWAKTAAETIEVYRELLD